MLGYMLNVTGQEKLQYIGHSMGPAAVILAMTFHPEIANKIKLAHFFAPYVYSNHIQALTLDGIPPIEPLVVLKNLLNA